MTEHVKRLNPLPLIWATTRSGFGRPLEVSFFSEARVYPATRACRVTPDPMRRPDPQSKLGLTDAALWGAVQEMSEGLVELAKELLAFEDRQLEIALSAGEIVQIINGNDKA